MKMNSTAKGVFFTLLLFVSSMCCYGQSNSETPSIKEYEPIDQELFDEIIHMDKVFFEAYNTCDLDKQAEIYSDSIEFFHDKGGLMTSKKEIIEGTKKNICGKVTRELIEESVEVYPIHDYGAVQIGFHEFYNNQEPNAESVPSKFIMMWKKEGANWRITKVISLH